MSRLVHIFIAVTILWHSQVNACSYVPGYGLFELSNVHAPMTGPAPDAPDVWLHSIERGSNDGDYASCSDAGVVSFGVDSADSAKTFGFIFEVEYGEFPDAVFPDEALTPQEYSDGSFRIHFFWLDLPRGHSRVSPIDARISVRAISRTGVEGPKTYIDIKSR
ncbi:MAG: hypothetical protein AAF351_08590 [Pseudomonadota bacterium]